MAVCARGREALEEAAAELEAAGAEAARNPTLDYMAGGIANAGLVNFTRALADLAAPDGVLVNAVSPGVTATERFAGSSPPGRPAGARRPRRCGPSSRPNPSAGWYAPRTWPTSSSSSPPSGRASSPAPASPSTVGQAGGSTFDHCDHHPRRAANSSGRRSRLAGVTRMTSTPGRRLRASVTGWEAAWTVATTSTGGGKERGHGGAEGLRVARIGYSVSSP